MIALLAAARSGAALDRAIRAAPPPVRALIARRDECEHWAGEEGYDAARARDIDAAIRRPRCARLEADARALRRRYARRSDLLRLLEVTKPEE